MSGAKKDSQSQKLARTAPQYFLNSTSAAPRKTRVLKQIAPESSLDSSTKSLPHKLFVVPFSSLSMRVGSDVCVVSIAWHKIAVAPASWPRASPYSRRGPWSSVAAISPIAVEMVQFHLPSRHPSYDRHKKIPPEHWREEQMPIWIVKDHKIPMPIR